MSYVICACGKGKVYNCQPWACCSRCIERGRRQDGVTINIHEHVDDNCLLLNDCATRIEMHKTGDPRHGKAKVDFRRKMKRNIQQMIRPCKDCLSPCSNKRCWNCESKRANKYSCKVRRKKSKLKSWNKPKGINYLSFLIKKSNTT